MSASVPQSRRSTLAVLALIVLSTSGAVVALAGNNASDSDSENSAAVAFSGEPAEARDLPLLVPVPDEVETVRPALKATFPDGVSVEAIQTVASLPEVAAAARVLLANLVVEVPGGDAQVSVAAVSPDEFRPLTPETTAKAKFVWEGLHRSQMLIAHEQYQIFGGKPLQTLAAKGPAGRRVLRVGGLASSGIPNLAGAMMSMDQATKLGLGEPTLLLVGLNKQVPVSDALKALNRALPGITFERTQGGATERFFSGASAQRAIGNFRFISNPDGTISQDREWVARHITSRNVPLLGQVTCHRAMLPQLEAALTEIRDSGLSASIKPGQYGGCYVPRFIERDGTKPLSMHAWGLAVDINVADNPAGAKPNMDPAVVAIFEKWGFRWGGRWSRPDGHHFELAALISG
ncbi:MAG TPA: M15 family metallopeptidase [Actinomycetota bacterium]|nr:M15 family metallopeptidase [Actinomycetota bacterium]